MELHFADEPLKVSEEINKSILETLQEKEQIEVRGDYIIFKNFTGVVGDCLVIPRKLAEHFKLINESGEKTQNFYERYKELFGKFLKYILKNLLKST